MIAVLRGFEQVVHACKDNLFLEVRSELIPTHDSDVLTVWLREHEEELLEEHMDVRPSASRCQIQLVGAESDTCAAYKIEL